MPALNDLESQIEKWTDQINQGTLLADLAEEKVQGMHHLAFMLYRNKQYQNASHFFRLLVAARPSETKFWKGLGSCLQMLQVYEEALNCYTQAQILHQQQTDPYLFVYIADCYFALKQTDAGLKALEAARLSAKRTKDQRVLRHVAFMRDRWSK